MYANIDQDLYNSNLFYRHLIDQMIENERKYQEAQCQRECLCQEMRSYANQIPFQTMRQISPYTWHASYPALENNYTYYWLDNYNLERQQYEQQCRQIFKAATDVAALATENTAPVASLVFDSVGLMTADNLVDAVGKILSIIHKAQKL